MTRYRALHFSRPASLILIGFLGLSGCTERLSIGSVDGAGTIPAPPANAVVVSNIDQMANWKASVGSAAGCPANNLNCSLGQQVANYNPQAVVAIPTPLPEMDGIGSIFELLRSPSWADLVYGKSLGQHNDATHFIYDFWVNVSGTAAAALEYDIYQSIGGQRYMMGSECNYLTGNWDGWNEAAQHWAPIVAAQANNNLACPKFSTNQWHHIVWYNMRSQGVYTYLTLQVDGVSHPIDLPSFQPMYMGWGDSVGVQVQLDADKTGSPITEYVENMSVTMW